MKNFLIGLGMTCFMLANCAPTPQNISETKSVKRPSGKAVEYGYGPEIPEDARPNDATMRLYIQKARTFMRNQIRNGEVYTVRPAGNAVPFDIDVSSTSQTLEREFNEGYLLSYLYYDDGVVKYDAVPAKARFNTVINNDSYFFTHSTGKSITSYIVGHAICEGYISSIDEPVDWPQMSETLYQGQPLIDLLNMKAGDAHTVQPGATRWKGSGEHHRRLRLQQVAKILRGTQESGKALFYNNTLTDLIANYTAYKAGDQFDTLMKKIFREKVKIENPVYLEKQNRISYSYFITRNDLLRIAVAMMKDYQNGTCVGQYLKDLQAQQIPWPNYGAHDKRTVLMMNYARYYGGQFYWGFDGMRSRNIMGANGALGQNILIDLDNSRIVVTQAIAAGWDTKALMVDVIKKGELPN